MAAGPSVAHAEIVSGAVICANLRDVALYRTSQLPRYLESFRESEANLPSGGRRCDYSGVASAVERERGGVPLPSRLRGEPADAAERYGVAVQEPLVAA